ncbi:HEAT repeat-containing protein 1-like isoform X2 [Apostichopus japonicus]
MTSLAEQLKKLAVPQGRNLANAREKRRKSILFDSKEAAGLNRETVYAIGVNGVQELATIDPSFQEFEETLFSEGSKTMERSVQTVEVNKNLDKHIRSFLLQMSPYFTLKPAQKAMEWLVYRFGIHEYNINDVMMAIMPYHTTKVFVRVVQIIDLSSKSHPWNWLKPIQETGVSLSRSTVLTHCWKDPGFLQFVCNMVPYAIKAHKAVKGRDPSRSDSALRIMFSFYASTVIGAMEHGKSMKEQFLATLVPFLMKGLKSSYVDYRVASYMVLSQMSAQATLDERLLLPIMDTMCKNSHPSLEEDMISCLAIIYQTQDVRELQDSALTTMSDSSSLLPSLKKLTSTRDINPFLLALLRKLVSVLLSEDEEITDKSHDKKRMEELMERLIAEISLDRKMSLSLIRFLLKMILKRDDSHWTTPFFSSLISNLERQYPESMDEAIQKLASTKLTNEKEKKLQTFLHMTSSGCKHEVLPEVETSLVLSLNHPNSETRRLAVRHLLTLNQSGTVDSEFLQSALSLRIEDRDPRVIFEVLQFGEDLCNVLSPEQVAIKLEKMLSKWHRRTKGVWPEVAAKCIELLTSRSMSTEESAMDAAFAIVLPYLLPSTSERTKQDSDMFHCIVTSDLGESHGIMKNLSKFKKKRDNLSGFTAQLLQQMAQNLSEYPTEERRNLVKFLLECGDAHHLKEAYRFAISLILTRTVRMLGKTEQMEIIDLLLESLTEDLGQVKGHTEQIKKEDVTGIGIPEAVLTGLCQLLTKKESTDGKLSAELLLGHLWCLESIVATLERVEMPGEENAWLELHANSEDIKNRYLLTLVKLFDLLTQSVAYATDGSVTNYLKEILGLLIQKHFQSTTQFWRFLSLVCTSHCRLHGDSPYDISYLFQVCCLEMANISFSKTDDALLDKVLQKDSIAFLSLLLNLGHPSKSIRKVAVDCLTTVQTKSPQVTSPYGQMLKLILKRGQEIIDDEQYLPQALKITLAKLEKSQKRSSSKGRVDEESAVDWLADCISSEQTPHHVRCALVERLALVESKALLSRLITPMKNAVVTAGSSVGVMTAYNFTLAKSILGHFRPATADLLNDKNCRDSLWLCLSQEALTREGTSMQCAALDKISVEFFLAMSEPVQQDLFQHLIALSLESQSPDMVKVLNRVLRKLPLSPELIADELKTVLPDQKLKNLHDAKEARRRKQQKKTDQKAAEVSGKSWQRATFILELLSQKKLHKMENASKLVPELFSLLALCLEADSQLDSLEYIKQLLLTLLHTICENMTSRSADEAAVNLGNLSEEQFNVELVVQCVRTSDNPQTHNHALLVLNVAAQLFPEHLLHNIMSIFTFMGANVLRQDDGYSFQVINKTLQTVIPALLKASNEGALPQSLGTNVHKIVFMIIRIFVDAFPHIPDHRKLPLFTQLIETVNAEQYLWSCIVLLVESVALKGPGALYPEEIEDIKVSGRNQQFWMALCHHFSSQVQIISITKMIQYLSTFLDSAPIISKSSRSQPDGFDKLLDKRRFSGKQLRQFQFTTVGFFSQLLSSDEFISKVASLSEEEKVQLQGLYQVLLEENLRFAQQVAQCGENNADNATAKFWKALLHRTYDVLDKVNALLPVDVFIQVISGLLGNKLASVRRKAMELLNNILVQHKDRFTENEHILLLGLIPQLVTVAQSPSDTTSTEVDVNRQTALYSLKLLCKLLGSESSREFTPVMELTLEILQKEAANTQLVSSALLCLAETVCSLRAYSIPFLSRMVPTILKMLAGTKLVDSMNLFMLCAVTAVQKIVETLPNFISPYVGEILQQVSRLSCNHDDEKTQLNLRLKACRQMLSKKLPLRVLLPAVAQTYTVIENTHSESIVPLMNILQDHINTASKEDVLSHHSTTMTFFLDALDYRTRHPEVGKEEVSQREGAVIDSILMHIMKLSETTFRPMYYKFYDWSTQNNAPRSRLLSFYNLSGAIADKLKSIFSLFAGHIISNCAQLLDANNSAKTEEPFYEDDASNEKSNLLVQLILACLHKCFLHDKGAFVSKERFELLSQPVIDQLENVHGSDAVYEDRIKEHVGPCVSAMMSSVSDQSIWQPLNYQLLLKMRHTSPKIRFAALVVLDQVHQSLKQGYLSLLPETIPFLAELMEDESEEVEEKCQELVKDLEKTLGEPLQKHF